MSAKLREYLTLVNRLRHLKKIGRFETEMADNVRGLMEDIWRGLSADEAKQATEASRDVLVEAEDEANYLTE
jgi:hypothetical protein